MASNLIVGLSAPIYVPLLCLFIGMLFEGRFVLAAAALAGAMLVLIPVGLLARRFGILCEIDDESIALFDRRGERRIRWADVRRIELVPSRGNVTLRVEPQEGRAMELRIAMAIGRALDAEAQAGLDIARRQAHRLALAA